MSSNTLKMLGGVIVMVIATYYLGPGTAANLSGGYLSAAVAACSIAYGLAVNALFPPKSGVNSESEVSYSTATKGQAINVPFGTTFVQPNFIEIDESLMSHEAIKAGKGGGTVVGYNYFIPYSCYLCVGPIDRIIRMNTSPGQEIVYNLPVGWGDANYINLTVEHEGGAGGVVRVYQGTPHQTREPSGDLLAYKNRNYRNFAWMYLGVGDRGHGLGGGTNALSYEVLVERIPKCPDTLINGRGSNTSSHIHYNAANPAAVIFECLTNPIWGLNTPYDDIDIPSFEAASYYFAEQNIGVNFTIENFTKMSDVMSVMQSHCDCTLLQKGGKITFRTLQSAGEDLAACVEVNEDNSVLEFQSATYDNLPSELTIDWTNPDFNYKNDTISLVNPATWEITGGGNPTRVSMSAFYDSEVVQKQGRRLLRKLTNPRANAQADCSVALRGVELGDLVRVVSSAWAKPGKKVVVPMRVVQMTTSGSDAEKVTLIMQEDIDYPRLELDISSSVDSGTIPVTPWDEVVASTGTTGYVSTAVAVTPFSRVKIFEVPPVLGYLYGDGVSDYIIGLTARQPTAIDSALLYNESGSDFVTLGTANGMSSTGVVTTALDESFINRDWITVTMDKASFASDIVTDCGYAPPGSEIDNVLSRNSCYAIIDEEIIQIGYAELVDSTHIRMTNVIRGCFATPIKVHGNSTIIHYIGSPSLKALSSNILTERVTTDFKVLPISSTNKVISDDNEYPYLVLGKSSKQLGPAKVVDTGTNLHIYPRSVKNGAGMQDFAFDCFNPPATIDHQFVIREITDTGGTLAEYTIDGTYVPPNPLLGNTGRFETIAWQPTYQAREVRIYAIRDGALSTEYCELRYGGVG